MLAPVNAFTATRLITAFEPGCSCCAPYDPRHNGASRRVKYAFGKRHSDTPLAMARSDPHTAKRMHHVQAVVVVGHPKALTRRATHGLVQPGAIVDVALVLATACGGHNDEQYLCSPHWEGSAMGRARCDICIKPHKTNLVDVASM